MRKIIIIAIILIMGITAAAEDTEVYEYKGEGDTGIFSDSNNSLLNQLGKVRSNDLKRAGVSKENISKLEDMFETVRRDIKRNTLEIQKKQLDVKKLLLDENKNWSEIEKKVYEISRLRGENGIKLLRLREDVKSLVTEEQLREALRNARIRKQKER